MLDALAVIDTPGFEIASWPDRGYREEDGVRWFSTPYPDYHACVYELLRLCSGWGADVDPYGFLPEDPPPESVDWRTTGVLATVGDFEGATLNQLRRYFVLCARGERFGDGHIANEFREGRLQAAVRRLRKLRSEA